MACVEQELRDRWADVAGTGRPASYALDGLLARYREPHRHYHGLAHVVRVLRDVDDLLGAVMVADADAVRFAAWFHDAIYDPRAPTGHNEDASAQLATEVLTELSRPTAQVVLVARLVRATAQHHATSPDDAVLLDADLAVLASDPASYTAYARGVRREYAHVGDDDWRVGRAAVLRGFLARPEIFATAAMHAREPVARANLAAELAGLVPPTAATVAVVSAAPDTVVDALEQLRAKGYDVELVMRDQRLRCPRCTADHPVHQMVADHVYRFEGDSDPGDEAIVIGVTCPTCGARGAIVSAYGPDADPDELAGVLMIAQRYAGG